MTKYNFKHLKFCEEHFICGQADSSSIVDFLNYYKSFLVENELKDNDEIWVRLFFSDIENQYNQAQQFINSRLSYTFPIGQPPANNSKISLQAYLIKDINQAYKIKSSNGIRVNHGSYVSHWQSFLPESIDCINTQCQSVLNAQDDELIKSGQTMRENLLRTWFYVRDIDNNYSGLVEKRRDFFKKRGLTKDTNYITSTGIGGRMHNPKHLVTLHSLTLSNINNKQVKYLKALNHLGRTDDYGVTFERGTSIEFGDRTHIYISGTASIDPAGEVLHINDVRQQTVRVLENLAALLIDAGANLKDSMSAIVYLRDRSDLSIVESVINDSDLRACPTSYVEGHVCRPSWLVEIELFAIKKSKNSHLANFIELNQEIL